MSGGTNLHARPTLQSPSWISCHRLTATVLTQINVASYSNLNCVQIIRDQQMQLSLCMTVQNQTIACAQARLRSEELIAEGSPREESSSTAAGRSSAAGQRRLITSPPSPSQLSFSRRQSSCGWRRRRGRRHPRPARRPGRRRTAPGCCFRRGSRSARAAAGPRPLLLTVCSVPRHRVPEVLPLRSAKAKALFSSKFFFYSTHYIESLEICIEH